MAVTHSPILGCIQLAVTHSPILGCIRHGFAERAYSGIFETAHGSCTTRSIANATQSSGFTRPASASSVENGIATDENSPKTAAKNARPSSLYPSRFAVTCRRYY